MSDRKKQEQPSEPSWLEVGMGLAAIGSAAYLISKAFSPNATPSVSPNSQFSSSSYNNHRNPDHSPTGPGGSAGYHGSGTKADLDNHNNHRANQCNPNHLPSGPGRPAGYHGLGTKADLDNHSRQLNPQDPKYHG